MRRGWKILALFLLLLPVTGCWDRVEIEERGFVIGAAIDQPKSTKSKEKQEREAPNKPQAKHRYAVTYQIVVPSNVTKEGGGGGGGGGGMGDAFMNITSEADSLFEVGRELATRTSRTPYFEHLKLIVVSEKVARTGELPTVLDFFLRDPEMRRGTMVMISKGRAQDVLEVKPPNEKLPALYIQSVSRNYFKNSRMQPLVRLGKVHEYMLSNQSFSLSVITPDKKEVKVAENAVFRGNENKMLGYLNEEETEGQNFLLGKVKGGLLKVPVKDNLITYEIMKAKKSIKADIKSKDKIHFTITVQSEGRVAESLVHLDFLKAKHLNNIETFVEKEILRMTQASIEKLQHQYKADTIGLGKYIDQHNHKLWTQIKNDWDRGENYFANCGIEVKADVKIRNAGIINHTGSNKE